MTELKKLKKVATCNLLRKDLQIKGQEHGSQYCSWNQLLLEMNNTFYTNAIAFVLFIRFCVLPGLPVNFISIEIF